MPRAMEQAELSRIFRVKQGQSVPARPLGPEMVSFFQHSVQKRHVKLSAIAGCWAKLVPPMLSDHCALESLNRGTLTVLIDSASHLYELKQLLLAGLEQQLLLACKSAGLRKIALKPGRWYETNSDAGRKLRFD